LLVDHCLRKKKYDYHSNDKDQLEEWQNELYITFISFKQYLNFVKLLIYFISYIFFNILILFFFIYNFYLKKILTPRPKVLTSPLTTRICFISIQLFNGDLKVATNNGSLANS
jgi:hypothetical protein